MSAAKPVRTARPPKTIDPSSIHKGSAVTHDATGHVVLSDAKIGEIDADAIQFFDAKTQAIWRKMHPAPKAVK